MKSSWYFITHGVLIIKLPILCKYHTTISSVTFTQNQEIHVFYLGHQRHFADIKLKQKKEHKTQKRAA